VRVADSSSSGLPEQRRRWVEPARLAKDGIFSTLADSNQCGCGSLSVAGIHDAEHHAQSCGGIGCTSPTNGHWRDADWLGCRDGKFRPVETGTFPLANGIPNRVGRLRGYGNAIVPQQAAEFIQATM
jgi:DNA (cytosine-5)-methyltransferase 1